MNLRWLFWTGLLATMVFFTVVYFGIKYDWVGNSKPTTNTKRQPTTLISSETEINNRSFTLSSVDNSSRSQGNNVNPELIDEMDLGVDEKVLGSADLTIEEVVSQCQTLSESIGIPQDKLDQAIGECIDRNTWHLTSDNDGSLDARGQMIREQCNVAITQKELLSNDEIKMLVDECVAAMSPS